MKSLSIFIRLCIAIILILVSGCGEPVKVIKADKSLDADSKLFKPKPKLSSIYIYRETEYKALGFNVKIDHFDAGVIAYGTFIYVQLPPGKHTISSIAFASNLQPGFKSDKELAVVTKAGENYFFWQDITNPVFGQSGNYLHQVDEATGISAVSKFDLAQADPSAARISNLVVKNLPPANLITAPTPQIGNSGKYMSPYAADGSTAPWAYKVESITDNGSDIAAAIGSSAAEHFANKSLEFIPFGLGGLIARQVGDSAARAATRKTIEAKLPTIEEVRAGSDLSFNNVDDLAVFMYSKYSYQSDYLRVLLLTESIYPELEQKYESAINNAASKTKKSSGEDVSSVKQKTLEEKLDALKKLKDKGLINEADYQARKNAILDSM